MVTFDDSKIVIACCVTHIRYDEVGPVFVFWMYQAPILVPGEPECVQVNDEAKRSVVHADVLSI